MTIVLHVAASGVLTTEPDEFDKDFVRYGLLTQAGEQATTHRPVTAKEILNLPSGPQRDKWIAACQKELGGLKSTRTKSDITLKQMEALKIKNEKAAQRGSFWDEYPADIRGSFARIFRPKTSVRAVKILEKQAFRRGHP